MQSCSNEFFAKISNPKMSNNPIKVSFPWYLLLFLEADFDSSYADVAYLTEIEELIFYTIQLKIVP